jgi:hypothetical protein
MCQKKKYKRRTHKAKDRVTRTPLKTGGELRCSGKLITDKLRGLIKIFWFNLTFIHLTLPTLNHLILIHSIFIYLVTFFTGTYTTRYQSIAIKYLYVSVLCI